MDMANTADKTILDMGDMFRVFFVGVILIVMAYLVVNTLVTGYHLPFWIEYVIYGLLVALVYLQRDKILDYFKKQR